MRDVSGSSMSEARQHERDARAKEGVIAGRHGGSQRTHSAEDRRPNHLDHGAENSRYSWIHLVAERRKNASQDKYKLAL